jgi:hypothetical protein
MVSRNNFGHDVPVIGDTVKADPIYSRRIVQSWLIGDVLRGRREGPLSL